MTIAHLPPAEGSLTVPRVVGLDLSLTGTGVAVNLPGGIDTQTVVTKSTRSLEDQYGRMRRIRNVIWHIFATMAPVRVMPDLVAVEGPSYASQGSGTWDRAGLWWLVVSSLLAEDIPVAVIPPTTLKKYATGKGNATKPDMRMAAYKRLNVDLRDEDQVDALWLAVAALDHLGHAQAVLPKVQRDCLAKVAWPARVEELSA